MKIERLTPEQEALIPVYREKWRAIALSTERIDRQQLSKLIQGYYWCLEHFHLIRTAKPEITFIQSPRKLYELQQEGLGENITLSVESLIRTLADQVCLNLRNQIEPELFDEIWYKFEPCPDYFKLPIESFQAVLKSRVRRLYKKKLKIFGQTISLDNWRNSISFYDFCLSELNCKIDCIGNWDDVSSLLKNSTWIFPFESTCVICDRPTKLSFDDEGLLHAENEPAILYADGFAVYAHHGKLINSLDDQK